MNKNIVLLLLLLGVGVGGYWAIKGKKNTSLQQGTAMFAVEDTAAIAKIEIKGDNGVTIRLRRRPTKGWSVNNYYTARPDAIATLLNTIKRLRVSSPVPQSARDNVAKLCQKPEREIAIYQLPDTTQAVMRYNICGITVDNLGTYMQIPDQQPQVVGLPGMDGILTTRYFTLEQDWRNRLVYDIKPQDIAEVLLIYPEYPEASFSLKVLGKDSFALTSPRQPQIITQLNRPFVQEFLKQFQKRYVESFENGYPRIDSLQKATPFCKMTVTTTSGHTQPLNIYHMPNNRRSKKQYDEKGHPLAYDLDRYFAFLHSTDDLAIIQQYVFGGILVQYADFLSVQ